MSLGRENQDAPPSYETILEMEKCPDYDEVILQINNLPKTNEEIKSHEINRWSEETFSLENVEGTSTDLTK